MNIDIEFIPTWVFNFKDLPIKINDKEVYITGTAEGYSANLYNNLSDKNNKFTLTFKDIEDINRIHIEVFTTQDMRELGVEQIPWESCSWTDYDEVGIELEVAKKLKELIP